MKRIITICAVICATSSICAQPANKITQSIGLAASASVLEYSVKGYLEPYITLGSTRKHLLVAPTILAGSNLGYQSPQSIRLTGARLGYRFWPGSLDNKWNFYLSADIRLQRLKDVWDANFYNVSLSDYQQFHLKTIEFSMENYLGYGLVFNINRNLRLTQGVGMGWYLSNLDARAAKANTHIADMVDYRGYDNIGFLWNVSFGVSYRLLK